MMFFFLLLWIDDSINFGSSDVYLVRLFYGSFSIEYICIYILLVINYSLIYGLSDVLNILKFYGYFTNAKHITNVQVTYKKIYPDSD